MKIYQVEYNLNNGLRGLFLHKVTEVEKENIINQIKMHRTLVKIDDEYLRTTEISRIWFREVKDPTWNIIRKIYKVEEENDTANKKARR